MARNLVRFDPFPGFDALERTFFENSPLAPWRELKMPATDVYTEDDKRLVMKVHLPGFTDKDISVDVDQNALVVQADRHEKAEDATKKYVIRESRDSYYRRFVLPEQADTADIDAKFEKGILSVTVPLKQLPGSTKIPVTSGDQ